MDRIMLFLAMLPIMFSSVHCGERRNIVSCEGSSLSLSCEAGTVINIIRANFGRFSNSVCPSYSKETNWSTRCINPTTLRVLDTMCGGKRSCSVSVSSNQFGDPCPDTPKYLEVVYKCQDADFVDSIPDLPEWIKSLKAMPKIVIEKKEEVIQSTSTSASTSTTFEAAGIPLSFSQQKFPDSQLLIQDLNKKVKNTEEKVFVNEPKKKSNKIENAFTDKTVLAAIVISAVSCFIIIFVGIIIFLNRDGSIKSDMYTVHNDASSCTYLQHQNKNDNSPSEYDYIVGGDGRTFPTIDPWQLPVDICKQSATSENLYKFVSPRTNKKCFQYV